MALRSRRVFFPPLVPSRSFPPGTLCPGAYRGTVPIGARVRTLYRSRSYLPWRCTKHVSFIGSLRLLLLSPRPLGSTPPVSLGFPVVVTLPRSDLFPERPGRTDLGRPSPGSARDVGTTPESVSWVGPVAEWTTRDPDVRSVRGGSWGEKEERGTSPRGGRNNEVLKC